MLKNEFWKRGIASQTHWFKKKYKNEYNNKFKNTLI